MVSSGFILKENGDLTMCVYCGGMLSGWHSVSDRTVDKIHAKHFPECKRAMERMSQDVESLDS